MNGWREKYEPPDPPPANEIIPARLEEQQAADLEQDMVGKGVPAALAQRLLLLTDTTKPMWGYCPDCHRIVKPDFPDTNAQLQAIKLVLEYLVGKPTERRTIDVNIRAIQAREELEQLSDAELLQIAEGEWEPLPSPPEG